MKKFKRHLVTAALPYANGPIHIGHLAGVYVPADIYTRYLRLKGEDVICICGSDEHGVPITIKARQEGISPRDIVDRYHKMNKKSFEELGISFSIFHRTTSKTHHQTATEFFKKLYRQGTFEEKTTEQYFDTRTGQFLADRYISGTCPKCGYEEAFGDQCEKCGSSLSPNELIHPRSMLSGSKPVLKKTKHWFLPLEKFEPFLREWILEQNKNWKINVYGQCKSWLDGGLKSRAVTRDLNWGIPVPLDDAEGKVLYVWFDAPIGYISATKDLTPLWEDYWKKDDTRLVHFIGKDNIVFHCIIFPSMLKAEGDYILPDNVPANEYLNLQGGKISTSRNWAVWAHEYLRDFPGKQDVLRYVLCANMPEARDNDFTWEDFQARNNNELVAILGNFVNRALVLTRKYYQGEVPSPSGLSDGDRQVLEAIGRHKDSMAGYLDQFKFREALKEVMNLARLGNKYLADTEPWKLIKNEPVRVRDILYVSLQITTALCGIASPFLPFTAQKLSGCLNADIPGWAAIGHDELLPPGHRIGEPELLFSKVEDKTIQDQLDKLKNYARPPESPENKPEPLKETIGYEEFSKMDIRIARILSAEKVPETDKLIKLEIDTGVDKRTLVAGIAKYYQPDDLPGRKICIIANLKPRKIRGITSHGMVLMAENTDGSLYFLEPSGGAFEGSVIR